MKVFLAHAKEDSDAVKRVGQFLVSKGVEVWLDDWCLTPGDSLTQKIFEEGIPTADRLVVFLSLFSVESNWVERELATGTIMELAEEKELGVKFVIPVLLVECKIPYMLRDKLYANFINKSFDSACEELYRGIMDQPSGPQEVKFKNRYIHYKEVAPQHGGRFTLLIEFGVEVSPVEGFNGWVQVSTPYKHAQFLYGQSNFGGFPIGGAYAGVIEVKEETKYTLVVSNQITPSTSLYFLIEADERFEIVASSFGDYYGNQEV
ncbi:MAG TPA: toll/interleukin-1 receptor domain-containing protein [Dehalococcoidia bacterium]|nr:toll/interleukin-1 receptor domain-containing protein [Dehalococcoidia bacterium]